MALRPLAPMSPERIEWESAVTHHVCELAEVSNGDAQGILEADPDGVDRLFEQRMDPLEAARQVLDITCSPGPTGPTDEERAAATAMLEQPWKLPDTTLLQQRVDGQSVRLELGYRRARELDADLEQIKRQMGRTLASLGEAREQRDSMRALAAALLERLEELMEYDTCRQLGAPSARAKDAIACAKEQGL